MTVPFISVHLLQAIPLNNLCTSVDGFLHHVEIIREICTFTLIVQYSQGVARLVLRRSDLDPDERGQN